MSRLPPFLNGGVPLVGKGAPVAKVVITLYEAGGGQYNIGLETPLDQGNLNLLLDKVKAMLVQKSGINVPPPQPIPLPDPPKEK